MLNVSRTRSYGRGRRLTDPKRFGRIGDRLLFYSKAAGKTFNRITGQYSEEQLSRYKYEDEGGKFRAENLTAPHFSETRTVEWRGTHPGANRQWRFSIDVLASGIRPIVSKISNLRVTDSKIPKFPYCTIDLLL